MKRTDLLTPLVLAHIGFEIEPLPRFAQYMYYKLRLGYLRILVLSTFLPTSPTIEFVFLGDVNSDYLFPRVKISTVGDLCNCIERGLESEEYSKEAVLELFNKIENL